MFSQEQIRELRRHFGCCPKTSSSKGGASATISPLARVAYVAKNGLDAAANDGSIAKPYLTIPYALSRIMDNDIGVRWDIRLAPGNYTEPFDLKPWVWIVGDDPVTTRISAPTIGLDAEWSFNGPVVSPPPVGSASPDPWPSAPGAPASDHRAGFHGVNLAGGPYVFDFNAVQSNEGKLTFDNVRFNQKPSFVAYSAINQVSLQNSYLFAGFSQTGISMTLLGTTLQNGGSIDLTSISDGRNVPTILAAFGGGTDGPLNAVWTASAPPSGNNVQLILISFGQAGPMVLDGSGVLAVGTVDSLPADLTRNNAAPAPTLLSSAEFLLYVPQNPADWLGTPPANVKSAIDRLAAAIGPIP